MYPCVVPVSGENTTPELRMEQRRAKQRVVTGFLPPQELPLHESQGDKPRSRTLPTIAGARPGSGAWLSETHSSSSSSHYTIRSRFNASHDFPGLKTASDAIPRPREAIGAILFRSRQEVSTGRRGHHVFGFPSTTSLSPRDTWCRHPPNQERMNKNRG